MKLSAVKHRSNTPLNYVTAHSLLIRKFMKEHHAAPSKLHKIIVELQYSRLVLPSSYQSVCLKYRVTT